MSALEAIRIHKTTVERYAYVWNIEKVSSYLKLFPIQKTVFMRHGDFQWLLKFHLRRYKLHKFSSGCKLLHWEYYTRLEALLTKSSLAEYIVEGRFWIVDDDDMEIFPKSPFQTLSDGVIRMDINLEDEEALFNAVTNDSLKLHLEIKITVPVNRTSKLYHSVPMRVQKQTYFRGLSPETRKHVDTIVTGEGSAFPAHKCVMSGASPIFARMLEKDAENNLKTLKIADFNQKIFLVLVNFIYSQKAPKFTNFDSFEVLKVLEAACKYDVDGLQTHATDYLMCNLQPSNVMDVLLVADEHRITSLKEKAIEFICLNKNEFSSFHDYGCLKERSNLLTEILIKSFSLQKASDMPV